jgi:hypothetical protein
MTRLKVFGLMLALVAAAPAAAFAQGSVAGDWDLTLTTPQGTNTVSVSFKQVGDGDRVTGTLTSPMGSVPLAGTATAGELNLTASIDVQGMVLDMAFTGKLAGDALSGTVKVGDFGEFPFTGARAAAKGAAAAASASTVSPTPSAGVGGKWNIVLSIAGAGDFPLTATLAQAADKVTGTISSQAGDVAVSGTMIGNALKLDFTAQTPQGDIQVTMTGTLGATGFAGKASIAGMGEADWTGTRAQ